MKFYFAVAALTAASSSVAAFTVSNSRISKATSSVQPLYGILDEINSDSFNLLGDTSPENIENSSEIETAYETFLAQIVFSSNDPRMDIVENIDLATDPKWLKWLSNKIENSTDVEEKMALRDLNEMILDIKKRIDISQAEEERKKKEAEEAESQRIVDADAEAEDGRKMSDSDVLRKAGVLGRTGVDSVQEADVEKKTFFEEEITPEVRMSYDDMCKKVLPPYKPGETPASVVVANYDQFDAQFIKVLKERSENGETESQDILDALAVEQNVRLAEATENLKLVLSAGDPMRMEGVIVKLGKEGKINEPFLLLLEANANQALAAGAQGPAQLMKRLGQRAMEEKDKDSSTKEIKLLRQLLRTDDETVRSQLLEDAFTPKTGLLVEGNAANAAKAMDGELPEEEKPQPEVPPPDFINACKAVLLNFGNLSSDDEKGDLSSRIKQIAAEAEVVATRIYGQSMSQREQQDRAWKDSTTSIFDLETLEIDAQQRGEVAPWANDDNDDILPGFDMGGKMKIGGT